MLNPIDFEQCIRDNLKDRHFQKERSDAIIKHYHERAAYHESTGEQPNNAAALAMKDTFDNLSFEAVERAKRTAKMLSVQVGNADRIARGANLKANFFLGDHGTGPGAALAIAAKSTIENDPRVAGDNYVAKRAGYFGQFVATFGDVLDKVSKGAFGIQKGKAYLPNLVREFLGEDTGDQVAKELAIGWRKVSNTIPEAMNHAGGSMRRLDNFLPNHVNPAKLVGHEDEVVAKILEGADWSRMRWPDGTAIRTEDRESVARAIVETWASDGANKIDETAFRGRGRAVGNMLNQHRFLHFKDGNSWLDFHDNYSDGTILDTLVHHMEDMSHKIALVDMYGPNPDAGFQNLMAQTRKAAAKLSPQDKGVADAVIKNKLQPMYDSISRKNPMDPHNVPGALITGASQMAMAAQLGGATLLAAPGDAATTAMVRLANGMSLFGGHDVYFKALMTEPGEAAAIARQSGFIMDDTITSVYNTTRFTGAATWSPSISKRVGDAVLRASMLSGHTRSARFATQQEFMGLLARSRNTAFEDLPFKRLLDRFAITKADWDTFRTLPVHSPKEGVELLRPIDFLDTKLAGKQDAYQKWFGLIYDSSREMVPDATVEASVMLKGTSKPDTLPGAILHSFSMYKNFPVAFWMTYGRLGMTMPLGSRLKFYAGLGAAMTMVGALGVQMREISKGRTPMPMDNAQFLGKAFLAGGALSIWGDFLFAGVNEYGKGPQDIVGGPLFSMMGDFTDFALGDVMEFIQKGDTDFSPMLRKGANLLKLYTPGSSLWYARLALERGIWDRLSELADPDAYKKRRNQVRQQQQNFGNSYWAPPKM